MIWAQVKGFVRSHNKAGHKNEVMRLVEMAVETVTPFSWRKCCEHAIKTEQEYWQRDHMMEDIEAFVINLHSEDESSDEE